MTILSNPVVAQQKATALSNGVSSLSEATDATTDDQTTVGGNANAQTAILAAQSAASTISSAINSAGTNVQRVAQDFEAMDQEVGRRLSMVPSPPLLGGKQ